MSGPGRSNADRWAARRKNPLVGLDFSYSPYPGAWIPDMKNFRRLLPLRVKHFIHFKARRGCPMRWS
jgi:hypothetical protein